MRHINSHRSFALVLTAILLCGCSSFGASDGGEASQNILPPVGEPELITASADLAASHRDPWHSTLVEAGIVEKRVQVGDVTLTYAEGPANGPPLLLLHAQHMDWYSYSRVLPELAESFQVLSLIHI